jgi:hypothetical protein
MKNCNVLDDLKLPDWSEMKDSSRRISPEAAFRLSEEYFVLFPEAAKRWRKLRRKKCQVEFVLKNS